MNFMTAVIDQRAFGQDQGYIERAAQRDTCDVFIGGGCDDSEGWFIEPTVIVTKDPKSESMVMTSDQCLQSTAHDDEGFDEVLGLCDEGSPYALTGSIFASNEEDVLAASKALRFSAGNFLHQRQANRGRKAQQPFGGARASGTNDKAGGPLNFLRWISPRSVKRTLKPPMTGHTPSWRIRKAISPGPRSRSTRLDCYFGTALSVSMGTDLSLKLRLTITLRPPLDLTKERTPPLDDRSEISPFSIQSSAFLISICPW